MQDFNRIAELPDEIWDHNRNYHDVLLMHVPRDCGAALEAGCGTGLFSRQLATRCGKVTALDLSPVMIDRAKGLSASFPNLQFECADILKYPLAPNSFDCIASIATLHHLPLNETLALLEAALRPGGVLLILDLTRSTTAMDRLRDALAYPVHLLSSFARTGRLRPPKYVREIWAEHGRSDVYSTVAEIEEACRAKLPGATIRRHLYWRYSLIWKKPS